MPLSSWVAAAREALGGPPLLRLDDLVTFPPATAVFLLFDDADSFAASAIDFRRSPDVVDTNRSDASLIRAMLGSCLYRSALTLEESNADVASHAPSTSRASLAILRFLLTAFAVKSIGMN